MRRGIAAETATGARVTEPFYLGLVAEALMFTGEVDQGLAELDQATARSIESGEKLWDAELHRLRGNLMCRLPRPDLDKGRMLPSRRPIDRSGAGHQGF
jgi:predicted ATPase